MDDASARTASQADAVELTSLARRDKALGSRTSLKRINVWTAGAKRMQP